jgi:hypothetical protein
VKYIHAARIVLAIWFICVNGLLVLEILGRQAPDRLLGLTAAALVLSAGLTFLHQVQGPGQSEP